MGSEEADQRAPEDEVQNDGRSDPLGPEGETGVGTRHPGLRQ